MAISQRWIDNATDVVSEEHFELARRVDVMDLIAGTVELKRVSDGEWAGPCPACGGKDRLHVRRDGWFCRQCQPLDPVHGWHNPIDWLVWSERLSVKDAVRRLLRVSRNNPVITQKTPETPDAAWQRKAAHLCSGAAGRLWSDEGKPGRDYLLRRGLEPHVWEQFGLGYACHWHAGAQAEIPAIVIPWVYGRKTVAVRFRFLNPPDKTKLVSLKGSRFSGVLFGSQGLPDYVWQPLPGHGRCAEGRSTLILCEGELNALSIWQVAHNQRVDVLSLGSESAKLTDKSVTFTQRYGQVIVWMDKGEVADAIAEQLPGAARVQSPKGKDANDWLQAGRLGEIVATMRWKAARNDDERAGVLWPIWDDAHGVQGIDAGTAKAFRAMCDQVGRPFDLVEPEPGRWVTRRWLEQGKAA